MPKANNLDKAKQNKGSKKALWIALVAVCVLILFIYGFILPMRATLFAPQSWNMGDICQSISNWSCNPVIMSVTGHISFNLTQKSGINLYNFKLACLPFSDYTLNSSTNNITYTPLNVLSTGIMNSTLSNGSTIAVSNLTCYNKKGPIGLQKAYTEIEARLWANYTLKPGIPNVSNRPVSKFVGVLIGGHPPASPP
jgi:hypothetical protein